MKRITIGRADGVLDLDNQVNDVCGVNLNDTAGDVISKAVAKKFLFEENTVATRQDVCCFFQDVFCLDSVCDETNNTTDVLGQTKLVVDVATA